MRTGSRTVAEAPAILRYGVGLLAVGIVLALRMVLVPVAGTRWHSLGFALAIMVAARFGGFGPGLVATATSLLAVSYFFLEPRNSFAVSDPAEIWGLVVFVAVGTGISLMSEQLRGTLTTIRAEVREREHALQRLSETQHRTSAILESISDGFVAFDREWRYTYVNAAATKMLRRPAVDLLGGNLWELWPRAYDSRFGTAYRRAMEENIPTVVEDFYPESLNAWIEVRCYPLADGLSLFFTDTTERKRAAKISRLLSSIVESSDAAILSKNLEGIVLSWNRGAERIYGYTEQEIVGRSVSILSPASASGDYLSILEALKQGRTIAHYEAERLTKDGRTIFVSLTVSPIRDEAGELAGASIIARDITEQKRDQEALRISEERYRSLVSATAQMVWTTSARGEVPQDTPIWRAFTGLGIAATEGLGWADAVHPEDRDRVVENWCDAVKRLSHYNAEYRVRSCNGQYRHLCVHGVPVLENDGRLREWIGTSADISDARAAEEEVRRLNTELEHRVSERTAELEAANRELEAFAYSVSHDLRAPLRAVDGFSRILLDEFAPQLPAEAQHYLEMARRNAVQMGELIDGLLAFSRLGRQPVRMQHVAPQEQARQAWEDLSAERDGRSVEMLVEDLPSCEADPLLLKQVFVNLLSNALKYTRTREVARIKLWSFPLAELEHRGSGAPTGIAAEGKDVVYAIRDNGVGFDMRYADKLFGVFQRLHRADEYEGTGIGLANVQRLIHKHGGSVWAWGEVDRGATFYFTLPGSRAGEERPTTEELERVPS